MTDDTNVSHALDLRPILGEIARQWQQLNPGDLTAPEALRILGVLYDITDRLDRGSCRPEAYDCH
jgi:hypothetical protein